MNRRFVVRIIVAVAAVAMWGCSSGNGSAPTITSSGKHPSGWSAAGTGGLHPSAYLAAPRQCLQCHGNDLRGGISGVSCFSSAVGSVQCHPQGPTDHPAQFALPANHGPRAKAAVAGVNGFAMCQNCHGTGFNGATAPTGESAPSCFGCHGVNAPHPPSPWLGSSSHATVDESNAPVCAVCHSHALSKAKSLQAVSSSTAPGCFNGTLCHGAVDHSMDPQPWSSPDNHGSATKRAPGARDGMEKCKACHGQLLDGAGQAASCFSCHQTAPHSPSPWRRTVSTPTVRTHVDTDPLNAHACAGCHQGNQRLRVPVAVTGNPTCFDNSLCHGATGHNDTTQFPVPAQQWQTPVNHGAKAKSQDSGNGGFNYCRNCHGTGSGNDPVFQGGRALTSCLNTLGCHGLLNNAPHPVAPWRGTTPAGSSGHTTADTSNDAICAICHTNGANSSRIPSGQDIRGTSGCFNATLCHGVTGHSDTSVYPAPWSSAGNHGAFARTNPSAGGTKGFTYCSHCHGSNFAGGSAQKSCFTCHGVSAPHPAKAHWTSAAGTLSHINTGEGNASVCTGCHNGTTKNLSTTPVNYVARFAPAGSFAAGQAGCFNGTLCHADIRRTSNCNVCHGPLNATAFNSLAGVTTAADAKVGVHVSHLNAAGQSPQLSANISCAECHTVPAAPGISGAHRNGATELTFGALAKTGNLTPAVVRDGGTGALVCSNTYCHGATLVGGSNKTPRWNNTGYLAGGCGTCHGFPPNTGIHSGKTAADCHTCHTHVNNAGDGFVDPSKHVNGTIEATAGHDFPFPGSAHRTATNGTGCIGCHAMGTGASSYPVLVGTAPDCRGCHLNANPTSHPHCSECHGDAANDPGGVSQGRPNGNSFPNRQGSGDGHNRGTHRVACTVCHPFSTGDARHGWSNRTRSSNAQVLPGLNWNPGTRGANQGSCNPGAGGIGGCHNLKTGWY